MKKRIFHWLAGLLLAAALLLALARGLTARSFEVRFFPEAFSQSDRKLNNPDRGFYTIRAYSIENYPQYFQPEEQEGEDWPLELAQINLKAFRGREITQTGLENMERLFELFRAQGKRFLIRFLYDWSGEAWKTEPESLEQVLTHMRQLSPILKGYDDCIFLVQGLFVGNWGEMNGTPFVTRACLEALTRELLQDVGEETFLSVRTPAQWRGAVGGETFDPSDPLAARLGLFNDGILGNSGDCGTYTGAAADRADPFASWSRADELDFQQELCKYVPNGGEVITSNPLNDFDSALEALRTMHITYLNWDYDKAVLDKWAKVTVEEAPFTGMDGLTYMERHLGYRYYIDEAIFEYDFWTNRFRLGANLKNDGFAPCYSEKELTLTLVGERERYVIALKADLRSLPGGNQREDALAAQVRFSLAELGETEYRVYLKVSGLELANEQSVGAEGIYLGRFCFRHPQWYDRVPTWLKP